ncbi:MAG TPA: LysR family transcriptional regulator [Rectinemataceae bacterium]|nr:LysR family transcriptional regulator [Rectinemataceae bacterium]
MTLRHYRIFLGVCEAGSMTAAAESLGMTQPPVSQGIAELERHYGVRLFERLGRKIRITPSGEILRSYAIETLRLVDEAERGLFELQDAGSLRVGASMTIGGTILPLVLADLRIRQPRIRLSILVDNTSTVIGRLKSADLDLGFVEGMDEWPDMAAEALYEDELALVCGPGHELAGRGSIKARDLDGRSFIVREEGSGTREAFAQAMGEADLSWEAIGVANGTEAIVGLVSAGLGLAYVSRLLVHENLAAGRLVALEVEGLSVRRKFRIVRRRAKQATETMAAFVELCRLRVGAMKR